MRPSRRSIVSLAVTVLALKLAAAPQTPAPPQTPATPTFHSGVDIVQVDVSVLDKAHKPVHGLTASDFTITVDDVPQPVAAFAAVEIPDAPPTPVVDGTPVTWMRDVASDVQSNDVTGQARSRLLVMVIDDALLPVDPHVEQLAKTAAKSVISKLGPDDQMAIVYTADSRNAQNFTTDRARLTAAVDKLHAGMASYTFGYDGSRVDADILYREGALTTLEQVADALMGSPERRKTLIFLSPGIPINPGWAAAVSGLPSTNAAANSQLVDSLPDLFRRMQRANVSIYAIDPTGTAGIGPIAQRALSMVIHTAGSPVDPSTGLPMSGRVPLPDDLAHFEARMDQDFLLETATNTGGRAIVGTDNLEPGIVAIFSENASYYLLGYRTPPDTKPGSIHRLTVKVDRPDVEVRTRNRVYAPDAAKAANAPAGPLTAAITSLLPSAELPMQVALAPVAVPGQPDAAVLITLGLHHGAPAERTVETVDLQTSAFGADGKATLSQRQTATVTLRAGGPDDVVQYEALSRIDLKPGHYQLRIAAHRSADDTVGSVFADVDVPDFTKAPLSLSGVMIDLTPPPPAAPRDLYTGVVPVVPTTVRTFTPAEHAQAFMRIYEGGTATPGAVTMSVALTNEEGHQIAGTDDTVPADAFNPATRSVSYRFDLPLDALTPGEYLLTFIAHLGQATSRRDVRFTVH